MKKRSLFVLLIVLTIVFATFCATVALAEDGETTAEFTQKDLVSMIITYCVFGVSVIFGIPAIRAVNKRKKKGYIDAIVKETKGIVEKIKQLNDNRAQNNAKRENLKYSFKIATVADMALTTYTQKQIGGYFELYNDLTDIKTRLAEIEKTDKNYDEEFSQLIADASAAADKAETLAANENIIRQYNK